MPTLTATEKMRLWREQNPEKARALNKAQYLANREKMSKQKKRWKAEHPERTKELNNASYHRTKGRSAIVKKAYLKTDRGKAINCAKESRRRERLAQVDVGDDLSLEYAEILRYDPCSYCGDAGKIAIDHIDPLNGGGDGSWTNLTAACKKCNTSKRDKTLLGWLR